MSTTRCSTTTAWPPICEPTSRPRSAPIADCSYWQIFEELRAELGYADYLGSTAALSELRPRDFRVLAVSHYLVSYPFANRLYTGSLDALDHCATIGTTAILSDGDVVFQPHKISRAGLHDAVGGRVLVYIHKELELDDVEDGCPPTTTCWSTTRCESSPR